MRRKEPGHSPCTCRLSCKVMNHLCTVNSRANSAVVDNALGKFGRKKISSLG